MSAVVKIDGAGNLPTFLDRAQAGLDRMVKSEHNVKGALRGLSEALDSTGNSAQMASQAANVLAERFVRGIGGAAVVGAFKLITDQMNKVSETLGSMAEVAAKAHNQLQAMGDPKTFGDATNQAAPLLAAFESINLEIKKMEANNFKNLTARLTGVRDEMEKLAASLKLAADAQMALGAASEAKRTRDISGMNPEQVKRYDLNLSRKAELDRAQSIGNADLRESAIQNLKDRYDQEDTNTLNANRAKADAEAAKYELKGIEADASGAASAEAIGADFDRRRAAYKDAETERIRKLNEDRDKLTPERILKAQGQLIDAAQQRFQAEKNNITAQGNASAIASGLGGSLRGPGQRMTSFEYGANKAVERAFQAAQKKEASRYKDEVAEDLMLQGKPYDGDAVNRELVQRRKKQAEQQAGEPFDAAKATQSALTDITKYMGDVQNLLNQLTQYAHVT
jgi:hypothetical protein